MGKLRPALTPFAPSELVNLVILGLLINSYYYGFLGVFITVLLVMFLAPISNEEIMETDTADEN